MHNDVKEKIIAFKQRYREKCFALANWKNLKAKDFSINEMLECICNAANGSLQEMVNIVDHLTAKNKTFGRTQVYGGGNGNVVDIIRNGNGELELRGYNPKADLPLKGQHVKRNPKIFRKTDDNVSKTYQNAEDRMMDLGKKVRDLFPEEDNHFITFAMQAIRKYAEQKKISSDKVVKGLEKGRYRLDTDLWRIIPNAVNEMKGKHIIVINESDLATVMNATEMTEHKFHVNMRHFISELLQDPVNAKVPSIFGQRGYTRSSLLKYLLGGKNPILIRSQRISDKDENGEPKTATMMVKFKCPKKNFERKLEKLFIKMFEKNLPPRKKKDFEMDEATACGGDGGDGAGQISQPMFSIQRRKKPTELEETTTTFNTGDYTYASPGGLGDKETLKRHDGENGSISINHKDD